jgi:hypothetical protein
MGIIIKSNYLKVEAFSGPTIDNSGVNYIGQADKFQVDERVYGAANQVN